MENVLVRGRSSDITKENGFGRRLSTNNTAVVAKMVDTKKV